MVCFILVSMIGKITTYLHESGRWITGSHKSYHSEQNGAHYWIGRGQVLYASAFRKFVPFFRTQFVPWQKVDGAYKVEWRGGLSVLPWIFAIHWMLFQKIPYVNPFCSQATTITSDRTRPRKLCYFTEMAPISKLFMGWCKHLKLL